MTYWAPQKWQGAPNLETVVLQGYPNAKTMSMLGVGLRATARIDLELSDEDEDWNPAELSEPFVSKIRSRKYHDIQTVFDTFAEFPTCSPQEIVRAERDDEPEFPHMSFEQWNLLARLPNLQRLQLDCLDSRMILSMPKSVKGNKTTSFYVSLQTDLELQSLATLLSTAMSTTRFSLPHEAEDLYEMGPEENRIYTGEAEDVGKGAGILVRSKLGRGG